MSDHTSKKPGQSRSLAEWISFSIAIVIMAILLGLVFYSWQNKEVQPPILAVKQASVRQLEGQFYVPFTVVNEGGKTVASVQVIGQLLIDEKIAEAGEQQIDFLSGGEKQSGAFIFTRNPQEGELILRVASYKLP